MPAAPLGSRQIERLVTLACPAWLLVTPLRRDQALVRRGLLRADDGGRLCITPAGLRALADAMEAGRVQDAIERVKQRERR